MTISNELLREAVTQITGIPNIQMRPYAVVADVTALAQVFPTEETFKSAIKETVHELTLLSKGRSQGTKLLNNHAGILSIHYRSGRKNGQKADLRLVYDEHSIPPRVRFFGHRHTPSDFYARLTLRKIEEQKWK